MSAAAPELSLTGRAALVTGAARGIGAAAARQLAANGARVLLADVDGDAALAQARAIGPAAIGLACDVRREPDVARAVARAVAAFGALDVLVANAGANAYFDAMEMTEAQWEEIMGLDLRATWLCAKHALPHLLESGSGAIVNVSSIHGRLTTAGMFPYAAAKAGVEGLTRSLALDYGPRGVRVNAVAPGYTRTRLVEQWLRRHPDPDRIEAELMALHPLRRIAEPEDVAAVIAFLASDAARAMTGAVVPVDCGLSARFAT